MSIKRRIAITVLALGAVTGGTALTTAAAYAADPAPAESSTSAPADPTQQNTLPAPQNTAPAPQNTAPAPQDGQDQNAQRPGRTGAQQDPNAQRGNGDCTGKGDAQRPNRPGQAPTDQPQNGTSQAPTEAPQNGTEQAPAEMPQNGTDENAGVQPPAELPAS